MAAPLSSPSAGLEAAEQAGPLLAYLFASPLTRAGGQVNELVESGEEVEALEVEKEAETFRRRFEDLGRRVRLRVSVATREVLNDLHYRQAVAGESANAPDVVHFTCHGFRDGFLALEDATGNLDRLSESDLRDMLGRGQHRTKLVFVSACYSEVTGKAFQEAGIPHVVAVRRSVQVADKVSSEFAVNFYTALLTGATVRAAFDNASNCIQLTPGRDNAWRERQRGKFLLLPHDADHDVKIFGTVPRGGFEDVSVPAPLSSSPHVTPRFVGRRVLMQSVVRAVLVERTRWVTLYGPAGIGKSSLAIHVCNFLCDRRHCKGVLFVPLGRPPGTGFPLRASLIRNICMHAPDGTGLASLGKGASDADLFAALQRLTVQSNCDGPLLIILDRCEGWTSGAPGRELASFISDLIADTCNIALICTTSGPLSPDSVSEERLLPVGPLSTSHAAHLLVKRCTRPLLDSELSLDGKAGVAHGTRFLPGGELVSALAKHPGLLACNGQPRLVAQLANRLSSGSTLGEAVAELFGSSESRGYSARTHQHQAAPQAHQQRPEVANAHFSRLPESQSHPNRLAHAQHPPGHPSLAATGAEGSPSPSSAALFASAPGTLLRGQNTRGPGSQPTHAFDARAQLKPESAIQLPYSVAVPFNGRSKSERPSGPFSDCWHADMLNRAWEGLVTGPVQLNRGQGWARVAPAVEAVVAQAFHCDTRIRRRLGPSDMARLEHVFGQGIGSIADHGKAQQELLRFWKWLERTVDMLLTFHQCWNAGLIYGMVSKSQVEQMLQSSKPGTFVVRISESSGGQLALAISQTGGRVVHSLVGTLCPSSSVRVATREGAKTFATFVEFLDQCQALLTLWPGTEKHAILQTLSAR